MDYIDKILSKSVLIHFTVRFSQLFNNDKYFTLQFKYNDAMSYSVKEFLRMDSNSFFARFEEGISHFFTARDISTTVMAEHPFPEDVQIAFYIKIHKTVFGRIKADYERCNNETIRQAELLKLASDNFSLTDEIEKLKIFRLLK
jgi:hypothetical protein